MASPLNTCRRTLQRRVSPATLEALSAYDVILLSDIGANTLLLHPDTWLNGKSTPNRLKLLKQWVEQGGALGMCGGYLSFAGINAAAKYYRTAIEDILPANIHTFDDRVEAPEGAVAQVRDCRASHSARGDGRLARAAGL